jgi:hypothetical protein
VKLDKEGWCGPALLLRLQDVLHPIFAVSIVKMQHALHVLASFGIRRDAPMSFNCVDSGVVCREAQFQIAAITAEQQPKMPDTALDIIEWIIRIENIMLAPLEERAFMLKSDSVLITARIKSASMLCRVDAEMMKSSKDFAVKDFNVYVCPGNGEIDSRITRRNPLWFGTLVKVKTPSLSLCT